MTQLSQLVVLPTQPQHITDAAITGFFDGSIQGKPRQAILRHATLCDGCFGRLITRIESTDEQ